MNAFFPLFSCSSHRYPPSTLMEIEKSYFFDFVTEKAQDDFFHHHVIIMEENRWLVHTPPYSIISYWKRLRESPFQ
uniref:Uncharacterized protein n=1 Tax=Candidatus Kentrum sp. LFY TaxID=2126342 RepID=A0A450X5P0_9GAMM|nr:MAG: hypothetical protein BECKLFY1418C_GA0070996_11844 [Candidatus Kentron sp. LFY]